MVWRRLSPLQHFRKLYGGIKVDVKERRGLTNSRSTTATMSLSVTAKSTSSLPLCRVLAVRLMAWQLYVSRVSFYCVSQLWFLNLWRVGLRTASTAKTWIGNHKNDKLTFALIFSLRSLCSIKQASTALEPHQNMETRRCSAGSFKHAIVTS